MRGRDRALLLGLVLALAGCELAVQQQGESGREAELERVRAEDGFAVLENGERRAVFSARGREVAIEPPEGYCLDEKSIAVSDRSAFVLVADCMNGHEAAPAEGGEGGEAGDAGAGADAALPSPFPGILTVSVSGETAFGEEPAALAAFESLLGTEAGGRLLGRGDAGAPGRVIVTRRMGAALYVLVEEAMPEGSDTILAPRFWRAFTEINERLVLVTVSGFEDRPLAEDEMLVFLAAQMAELRAANGLAPSPGERQIVDAVLGADEAAPAAEATGAPSGHAPASAPKVPRRPG